MAMTSLPEIGLNDDAFVGHYILVGFEAVKCNDMKEWSRYMSLADRTVRKDYLLDYLDGTFGEVTVSTVFLGLDHNHGWPGGPALFETMVFKGKHDGYQNRYSTWDEAFEGHERVLKHIKDDDPYNF